MINHPIQGTKLKLRTLWNVIWPSPSKCEATNKIQTIELHDHTMEPSCTQWVHDIQGSDLWFFLCDELAASKASIMFDLSTSVDQRIFVWDPDLERFLTLALCTSRIHHVCTLDGLHNAHGQKWTVRRSVPTGRKAMSTKSHTKLHYCMSYPCKFTHHVKRT